jgi:hypothetical protein
MAWEASYATRRLTLTDRARSVPGSVRYLSKTTLLACALLFVAGVLAGVATYAQRSPVVEEQVAGTSAIPAHVVLALVAVGIFIGLPRLRMASQAPYSPWVAPFSRSAFDRFKRTLLLRSGASPAGIVRAVLAGLLAILLLFNFFRAGAQVIGGLDPNFTVNAWGGPSYLGAMLAHYLDAIYLLYVEALLLNLVLVNATVAVPGGVRDG